MFAADITERIKLQLKPRNFEGKPPKKLFPYEFGNVVLGCKCMAGDPGRDGFGMAVLH